MAVGAVLSQLRDGVERPVALASRALLENERIYNFETEYIGLESTITVADFLSRVPVTPVFEDSEFDKDVIQMIDRSLAVVTPEELKEHSENDSVLQKVRSYVVDGWPRRLEDEQLRGFFNVREELSIWNDCCLARGQLAIIPSSLRRKVLAVAHERHLGMVSMKQRCRGAIWWPGIDRDIEGLVRECESCIFEW